MRTVQPRNWTHDYYIRKLNNQSFNHLFYGGAILYRELEKIIQYLYKKNFQENVSGKQKEEFEHLHSEN